MSFSRASQYEYVKHKIEAIDKEKLTYAYTLIEGDALGDKLEKICYEVKFETGADGGSICKSSSKFYTKGDAELKEEEIKAGREKAMGLFKAVEAYLLANPDSYI
ncbi:Bet v I/Major latex protein [Dillenia turbinata]|uniref:Bet v I/Major latex protein n=1 Tax=Dillenia turbinata TaxID=194707 RepID=A0AAN8Z9Z9_9MAGN